MDFKKDGLTFSDIIQARYIICGYSDADGKPYCSICPAAYPEHCNLAQYYMQNHLNIDNCYDFCVNNPRIAAEIMGFEVIDDGELQMHGLGGARVSDLIERDVVLSIIEDRQKALCPSGMFSRHSVYGSVREKFDAWQEIIDAIQSIPRVDYVEH